ncbi:MAG: ABC transporter ATP-binding protein [Desulfovibrionaceae bacterium]
MSQDMIRAAGVAKYFHRGGVNELLALDRVDLDVGPGEFVSVIGSNGAGKSTFLAALAGCFPLDGGSIHIAGHDVTAWPEYKRAALLGRVFQDPLLGTCAGATIEQNLALAARRGLPRGLAPGVRRADRETFRARLAELGLGLEQRMADPVGLLSGGQRQALTLLMATLRRPEVLLLDEHTAALDPRTARLIMDLTAQLVAAQGLTTLMVTHNMRQAVAFGSRLIMFHQGRIVFDVRGEEKMRLSVDDLVRRFYEVTDDAEAPDRRFTGAARNL